MTQRCTVEWSTSTRLLPVGWPGRSAYRNATWPFGAPELPFRRVRIVSGFLNFSTWTSRGYAQVKLRHSKSWEF
jgi:hypothetical protein